MPITEQGGRDRIRQGRVTTQSFPRNVGVALPPSARSGPRKGGWVLLVLVLLLSACRLSPRQPQPTATPEGVAVPAPQATQTATGTVAAPPEETPVATSAPAVTTTAGATPTPESEPTSTIPIPISGPGTAERLIGSYVRPDEIAQWCDEFQAYGVRFTWMAVPWNGIEPRPGRFRWQIADQVVQTAASCGLDIGFHILARSSWATEPPPASARNRAPSMPPKNMDDYYNFVFQLASRYKGIVSRYSVENEAHAAANWGSSPESYFELLATAYRAVKDADPNALVENSGLSSSAIGVLITNDLLEAGRDQDAVSFLRSYYADYAPGRGQGEPITVEQEGDLRELLSHPEAVRVLQWAPLLFANHEFYDVVQLHYFGPWEEIPTVVGWVRSNLEAQGANKPVEFWEFGYGWDDVSTYDPEAHARAEPKYLATALGEGALRALSWQFTDFAAPLGHPGLFTESGPRPAAESFRISAEKLNGTTGSERLDLGEGIWAYRFEKPTGDVYAIWSTASTRVSLPIDAATVIVTTITGETSEADPKALDVGVSPIFVEAP